MEDGKGPLVIFTGGGSAGPVTPLLAVAAVLSGRRPDLRLLWIGTSAGPERELVRAAGIRFRAVVAGKLRRYFSLMSLLAPFQVAFGLVQAWLVIGEERPAVVVSAGGFVAAPVIWAAWLRRVPVHVHQQDLRPTLTNVMTAPFAASVSVAFEKSLADFRRFNPILTGNPVRPAILAGSPEKGMEIFGLERGVPTVLVTGGGTGASSLNALVARALPAVVESVQVIHLTGRGKGDGASAARRYRQFELLTGDMPHALAAADLVVTRAGIGILSELAALGKPAVIVPMHGSHQEENARYFAERGAGVYVKESETFSKQFGDIVTGLASDAGRLSRLAESIRKLNNPAAAESVSGLVECLIKVT
jgi:UDP-N-acetylglucosamine--N-acetylmuramyl-(pentapeptide) pyrophosphoryl-undecaprenol N-acetylglucosamine transferase